MIMTQLILCGLLALGGFWALNSDRPVLAIILWIFAWGVLTVSGACKRHNLVNCPDCHRDER